MRRWTALHGWLSAARLPPAPATCTIWRSQLAASNSPWLGVNRSPACRAFTLWNTPERRGPNWPGRRRQGASILQCCRPINRRWPTTTASWFFAWRQFVRAKRAKAKSTQRDIAARAWHEAGGRTSGGGVSSTGGTASQPKLAVGGGVLHLVWAEDLSSSGSGAAPRRMPNAGTAPPFVEGFDQSGDVRGGITATGDGLQRLSLAVNQPASHLWPGATRPPTRRRFI